jgi:hypothetical protein
MSPLSCPDVEARLDLYALYAADECDPTEAEAVRRHLADCPRCAAACDEARQLVGLLELRLQEPERLGRLETRVAAEERPARLVLRFPAALRRVAALAAMLLLTAGPVGWLMRGLPPAEFAGGLAVALREEPMRRGAAEAMLAPAADVVRGMPKGAPEVKLDLVLRNTTDRPMRVWVAGPQTDLRLELRGPGVRSTPVKDRAEAEPESVPLRPGESYPIHVTGLTDSRRSWSWTDPGDYTLTAEFTTRAEVSGLGTRRVTARSDPLTIPVQEK